jgi:topoisomerase-4 subunit A
MVIETLYTYLYNRFEPLKSFVRAINDDDLQKLTQIRWFVLFDSDKADDMIAKLEGEMKEVEHHLAHLIDFALAYLRN